MIFIVLQAVINKTTKTLELQIKVDKLEIEWEILIETNLLRVKNYGKNNSGSLVVFSI